MRYLTANFSNITEIMLPSKIKLLGFFIDIPGDQVHSSQNSKLSIWRHPKPVSISYEALVWAIFTCVMTLRVVIDSFSSWHGAWASSENRPSVFGGQTLGETATNNAMIMIITSQLTWCFTQCCGAFQTSTASLLKLDCTWRNPWCSLECSWWLHHL